MTSWFESECRVYGGVQGDINLERQTGAKMPTPEHELHPTGSRELLKVLEQKSDLNRTLKFYLVNCFLSARPLS